MFKQIYIKLSSLANYLKVNPRIKLLLNGDIFWLVLIFILSTIFTVQNYPAGKIVIGGDIEWYLVSPDKFASISQYLSTWNAEILGGGVDLKPLKIFLLPVYYVASFLLHYIDVTNTQRLIQGSFILAVPISFYIFSGIFIKNKFYRFTLSIFYLVNPLTWLTIYRQIDFLTVGLFTTPLVIYMVYHIYQKRALAWAGLIAILIINLPYMTNPGYALAQICLLFFINIFFALKLKTKLNYWVLLAIFLSFAPTLFVYYTVLNSGVNMFGGEWNNKFLIETITRANYQYNGLGRVFIGLNQDIFSSDGYLGGKQYYFYSSQSVISNLFVQILMYLPLLVSLTAIFLKKLQVRREMIWLGIVLLLFWFVSKSSALPLGGLFEKLVNMQPFGIFRSPYQKFAIPLTLTGIMMSIVIYQNLRIKALQYLLKIGLVLSTIIFTFVWVSGQVIPAHYKQNLSDIIGYQRAAEIINKDNNIRRVVVLPFYNNTWVDLDTNYSGYHPFVFLLDKEMFNIGYISNNPELQSVLDNLIRIREEKLNYNSLYNNYQVDTLIFDKKISKLERRKLLDNYTPITNALAASDAYYKSFDDESMTIYQAKNGPAPLISASQGKAVATERLSNSSYKAKINNIRIEDFELKLSYIYSNYWTLTEQDCQTGEDTSKMFLHYSGNLTNNWIIPASGAPDRCFNIEYIK